MPASRIVRVRAFAKINLSLRVLGTLASGYHEIRTVFQSIALYDTLTIRRSRGPFRLDCRETDRERCPADSTNLVWRAADAVWKASDRRGSPRDVSITLTKRIPIAAGLGGGSSDGAAALRALAKMWRVGAERLPEIAASLGADVPYFLHGGTVLGLERGDVLFPLIDQPRAWVTLVVPSFGVSTKDAYSWWDDEFKIADRGRGMAHVAERGRGMKHVDERGRGPARLENDLQEPVAKRHPEIRRIIGALRRAGASSAAMTGSGSTVFGLFDRRRDAFRAAETLATRTRRTLVTRTLTRAECRRLAAK
jgi:4-diphosphocytidyl-2-C-methyl-D-erythritol kinase